MNDKAIVTKPNIVAMMATKFNLDRDTFVNTIKATVLKPDKGGKEATNAELIAFLIVAENYDLNPFTKEIYGFVDKGGGIVPIVSTDGWNKLMTRNTNYKNHYYLQSEVMVTLGKSKPCPKWMEIHIIKQDDSEVIIREYFDEVFQDRSFVNPWQTHTKRMFRHKTKIQGAREAFGLGGIYDEDEAQRIYEATEIPESLPKADVAPPQSKSAAEKEPVDPVKSEYGKMLDDFALAKESLGKKKYHEILGAGGHEHANEIKNIKEGNGILKEMRDAAAEKHK